MPPASGGSPSSVGPSNSITWKDWNWPLAKLHFGVAQG
jgi:hypothetical protein